MLKIIVNGDEKRVEAPVHLQSFLEGLKLDPKKVAVERNLEIVPKSTFSNVMLADGDRLEIVHFIGGG